MGGAREITGWLFFTGTCLAVGFLASLASRSSAGGWYRGLAKPAFTPPGWLFGPVWTALYILMGTAAWFVWKSAPGAAAALPLALFGGQLIANLGWSLLFFGLRRPRAAFVEICLLLAAVSATALVFRTHSTTAFWLMVPYVLWTGFALVLNFFLWRLNR